MQRIWCVYLTKNPSNGKFYYGKSFLKRIEKGYKGSGIWVLNSDTDDLNTEVIRTFNSEHEALDFEEKIVSQHIGNPKCMNMISGGGQPPPSDRRGEDHHNTSLSRGDVFSIRLDLMNGIPNKDIYEKFNIGVYCLSDIKRIKSWDYNDCIPPYYKEWLKRDKKQRQESVIQRKEEKLANKKKITNWDALIIRRLKGVEDKHFLAGFYGVNRKTIENIWNNKTYTKDYLYPAEY